ncbi:ATP-binding cassette domain-containing protein [Bailinhaonella thermotolerans]|uniref:ATP-binding cassette domain-containing protein n=1 Tax=Bailinhaonella thermotolerans TaxID=1070861 RepID=A0A3A4B510_9ACTN|nr:ATP-binding cassette domain-containing protein [Bailinhaonella thermotolerans]RJL36231.1 ATP-binding cassette domain-containing protein [Bailinhaonella thermotolerans]
MDGPAVRAEALTRRFGSTHALRGLDLEIPAGTVCGVLGPNGAGKTTAVRVLATLLRPDSGRAWIDGHDVVRDAARARRRLGLAGQFAAVDEQLTGRANLRMFAELHHLGRAAARRRADDLLGRFGLEDAAGRTVSTYSGGMRRRLDVAASLIVSPAVLFLDEPTTGLDPRGRAEVWAAVRDLAAGGTSVLLTTQYLDEADRLADAIVVIDRGRAVATGTPERLKAACGAAEHADVVVPAGADPDAVRRALRSATGAEPVMGSTAGPGGGLRLSVSTRGDPAALARVVRELDAAGVPIEGLTVRRPTLDDVFLHVTGLPAAGAGNEPAGGTREGIG